MIFITGTDTNIGKTIVASWICLHSGYSYYKPIQTGATFDNDTNTVRCLSKTFTHNETYLLKQPLSPHLAAKLENTVIDIEKIKTPVQSKLIIEGAGGLLVPINDQMYIIDIIKHLKVPVILVSRTLLGTINHTLLSLEILRAHSIEILGVIMSGKINEDNKYSIEKYGKIKVLAELPLLPEINYEILRNIPFPKKLKEAIKNIS